ncbi:hypothetical protein TVAG_339510 [Trichomonas vaginalis G3]|uniref:Uncharacterized protein n=1 Tax=Trichomonas vaginalis (strain ATCC PRA-98 / G3) TaxID=412133 RepID=A2F907_TRIV3|nr:hypothetical protein TVAGG3_0764420 [Trichomonas vaginalis G3]EAX98634.1 hypothetical protein TVAG_339510 [Trichomonas vaginalis G3]KAI5513436.1 hypothetical protein TVAGG3_0764420 [Trichomonas vaginalis G3]|eukprot:XP_001311564.1 hypothetical protein [Trichomonas vaginalis G3]
MCKQGFDLLSDFLNLTSQEHVFEAMLTSYFDCAFPFWTNFVENLIQSLLTIQIEETFITEAITQSILKSNSHLTRYHIEIIKIFQIFSETRCLQFLTSIFKSNFNRYTARQYIPATIQTIIDTALTRSPIVLYHALINVSWYSKTIPDAISNQVLYKIPLILSDRDVVVLLEILRDDKLQKPLQQLVDNANSLFRNGYCPFTFDLHSPMGSFRSPSAKTNVPSLVSAYAKYRQNCLSKFHDPIESLSNTNVSEEFIRYALRFEICNLKINMEFLSNNISILEQKQIFENYRQILLNAQKDSIAIHTSLILNQKSFATKQKVNLNLIFKDISNFSKTINFEEHPYSLCLRPAISIAFSKYNLEMSHIFNKISNRMTELIKKFRKDKEFIAVKPPQRLTLIASHLLKTVEIDKTKSKASYGQILDMLFYYIEALQVSDPNGTFEKLLFWRSFLPDDSKSEEARMILMTRLFIGFFIFRDVLEGRFYEFNFEEMLYKYMRIENCIMYPFVEDKDLMNEIIDKLLHAC